LSQERKIKRSISGFRIQPVKVSRGALALFALVGAFAISAVGAQNKVEKSGIEAVYDGLEWRFIVPIVADVRSLSRA